ncbi:MAG: hypothetical protein ACXQTR_00315 [Candidatus Methanospirareceae archaeon]
MHTRFTPDAAYGNKTVLAVPFECNASGVIVGSSKATAVAVADVVQLVRIPKGTLIGLGSVLVVSDAFTAATTLSLGFEYADGVDVAAFPENTAYFLAAGTVTSAIARLTATPALRPGVLSKDAYLILTVAGADYAAAGIADILLDVVFQGIKEME